MLAAWEPLNVWSVKVSLYLPLVHDNDIAGRSYLFENRTRTRHVRGAVDQILEILRSSRSSVIRGIASTKPVRLTLAKLANYWFIWEATGLLVPRRGLDFFAPRVDEVTVEESGRQTAERLRKFVRPDSVVLDLGCGLGRVAKYMGSFCKSLYAADASSSYCLRAKNHLRNLPNVTVVKVDGKSLVSFPDDMFDFVYSLGVLVHVKKEVVERYLQEVQRVLKMGGVFYFHLPHPEIRFPPFEWYSKGELEDLLATSQLALISRIDEEEVTVVMKKVVKNLKVA